jgi:hypothetical protein
VSGPPPDPPTRDRIIRPGEHAVARADALDALSLREQDTREIRWTARLSAALAWVFVGVGRPAALGGLALGLAVVLSLVGFATEVWGARRIRNTAAERASLFGD